MPSGNAVTAAAGHPSMSTHKYCGLLGSSQENWGKWEVWQENGEKQKRGMSRWEF